MARYLVAVSPIPGHVAPMLAVAANLRRRGHEVRMLTGAAFRDTIAAQGLPCSVLTADAAVTRSAPATGGPPNLIRRWRTGRSELRSGFLDPIVAQFRALTAELSRTDYDAVLVDGMFTGAVPLLLGHRPRPPVLACGVVPLMLSSADTPPFGMGWQPQPGRDYTAMHRFVRQVLFRDGQRRLTAILRGLGLGPAPLHLFDWPVLADRLLQFTVPGFEYPRRDLPPSVVFTGPIPIDGPKDAALPSWWGELAGARTVVHVTQGTWDNADLGQLVRPTLTALSRRADVRVVACTGGSRDVPGPLPANAHAAEYLPYTHLLPRVDVMVTNGGYGGVQQALRHGVPLIVAGDTADKPEVAARVAYTGAGIDLGTARPGPATVAAAVDRVLSNGEFRSAATRLGQKMAKAAPFDVISDVLAEVGGDRSLTRMSASRNGECR
ncbi:glycosyltransferase [Nocardia sp. XZ_19_369]|uniref:glycosyltransferase n=1 Tax=Nocardia sp. XZ_19_369 TaxID=2769487 RepID=UPI001890480E|nr:nucleotide disphospho-sugar-binding domain-containing protein [Nocardia sp. XZ_19_369]